MGATATKQTPKEAKAAPWRPGSMGLISHAIWHSEMAQKRGPQVSVMTGKWELPMDKVDQAETVKVGSGEFGTISTGKMKQGTSAVFKQLSASATRQAVRDFMNEITVMRECNHPAIVKLLGVIPNITKEGNEMIMCFARPSRGNLKKFLDNAREAMQSQSQIYEVAPTVGEVQVDKTTQVGMARDILEGVAYLADNGVFLRDLAARNCMVENDGSVVIGEFGLRWTDFATDYAKLKQSPMTTQLPVRWVAPELFNNFATCNHATEVWSYGVTVWEIATVGLVPYSRVESVNVEKFVADGGTLDTLDIQHLQTLTEIIEISTTADPAARPTYAALHAILLKDPSLKRSKKYGATLGTTANGSGGGGGSIASSRHAGRPEAPIYQAVPSYEAVAGGGGAAGANTSADDEDLYAVPAEASEMSAAEQMVLSKPGGAMVVREGAGEDDIYGAAPASASAPSATAAGTMVGGTMINHANVGTGVGTFNVRGDLGTGVVGAGISRLPSAVLASAEKQKELHEADSFYAEFPGTPTSGSLRKDVNSHAYDGMSPSTSASRMDPESASARAKKLSEEIYVEPNGRGGSRVSAFNTMNTLMPQTPISIPIAIEPTYEEPVAVAQTYADIPPLNEPAGNNASIEADATYEMPVMGGNGAVYGEASSAGGGGGGAGAEEDDLYLAPAAPQTAPRRVTSDDNAAAAAAVAAAKGREAATLEATYEIPQVADSVSSGLSQPSLSNHSAASSAAIYETASSGEGDGGGGGDMYEVPVGTKGRLKPGPTFRGLQPKDQAPAVAPRNVTTFINGGDNSDVQVPHHANKGAADLQRTSLAGTGPEAGMFDHLYKGKQAGGKPVTPALVAPSKAEPDGYDSDGDPGYVPAGMDAEAVYADAPDDDGGSSGAGGAPSAAAAVAVTATAEDFQYPDLDTKLEEFVEKRGLFSSEETLHTKIKHAAASGYGQLVRDMLAAHPGVNLNAHRKGGSGKTALHVSSENGYPKIVKSLLDYGCNPYKKDKHGDTALDLVVKGKNFKNVKIFLKESMDAILSRHNAEQEALKQMETYGELAPIVAD